ncbi:MAG TPA: hypothetical protein VD978_06470 [Azospirillum sp.]|nr:hypothetical protein [Azospirillum sp.]
MMTAWSYFQPIAELPGGLGFTVWGLGTRDDLERVVDPAYFTPHARLLSDGDIIVVNRRPPLAQPGTPSEKLLLLVTKDGNGSLGLRQVLALVPTEPGQSPKAKPEPTAPQSPEV